MEKGYFSLQGKFVFFCLLLVVGTLFLTIWLFHYLPFWTAAPLSILIAIPITLTLSTRVAAPLLALINALRDSTDNIKDHDFSVTIASSRTDELGDLVERHNEIGQLLREERHNINQRELLLDTVLQSAPVAMWLCDERQHIVYSNVEARQLLAAGRRVQGSRLDELAAELNRELADAIQAQREGLVSVESAGEIETYYLSCRLFSLNSRAHRLHLVRRMTREISRQEVNTWKKVIRVISHELNNSLAPISSLSHSGKMTMKKLEPDVPQPNEHWKKLDLILSTIGERATHLKDFIEGYAKFSRLPSPRIEAFDLISLLTRMAEQQRFEVRANHSTLQVQLDQVQLEQVLINLLKNARDASGPDGKISLAVEQRSDWLLLIVADDGPGMSDQVMQQALLPFYSTKQEGTGLGLPLCREIVEGHGGQLSIRNGATPGLEVIIRLPQGKALLSQ
ncbi:MAG: two-component system nitrogen regulation sensor histidine kinase NtrY [Halieaceae bacterium]|jgi:two-component system nitrogen regulation sensor histidine kinase NtrY